MLSPDDDRLRAFHRCAACAYSFAEIPHAVACPECGEQHEPGTLVVELIGPHPLIAASFGLVFALVAIGIFAFNGPLLLAATFGFLGILCACAFVYLYAIHGRAATHSLLTITARTLKGTTLDRDRGIGRSWVDFVSVEVQKKQFGRDCWLLTAWLREEARQGSDASFGGVFRATRREAEAIEQYMQERLANSLTAHMETPA